MSGLSWCGSIVRAGLSFGSATQACIIPTKAVQLSRHVVFRAAHSRGGRSCTAS